MAEHTKNLMTDPRASLLLADANGLSILKSARLTLIGDMEHTDPLDALTKRYVRDQPDAKQYFALGGLYVREARAKARATLPAWREMGWVTETDFQKAAALDLPDKKRICRAVAGDMPADIPLLGIDGYGFDAETDGQRVRHTFADAPIHARQLEDVLRRFLKALAFA